VYREIFSRFNYRGTARSPEVRGKRFDLTAETLRAQRENESTWLVFEELAFSVGLRGRCAIGHLAPMKFFPFYYST
jgi:hypothetical protein